MVGLDGAGKTTILYKLKYEVEPCYTEYSYDYARHKNIELIVWDKRTQLVEHAPIFQKDGMWRRGCGIRGG